MKKIIVVCLLSSLVGCYTPTKDTRKEVSPNSTGVKLGHYNDLQEVTYEGCQYIGSFDSDSKSNWGTHKGNCNNPIHKK